MELCPLAERNSNFNAKQDGQCIKVLGIFNVILINKPNVPFIYYLFKYMTSPKMGTKCHKRTYNLEDKLPSKL